MPAQAQTSASTRSSALTPGKIALGGLLLAALLFSWWANIKNLVQDWVSSEHDSQASGRPNILLIVADDLGYNDTDAINPGGLPTPNLKQLANTGVTFTRHYADATCTPSRVGILTGRYPERSGFRPVAAEIPAQYPTIAEQLSAAGYNTYLTGKWHAGEERQQGWPQHKGFKNWFGFLNQWETAGEADTLGKGARTPTYRDPMLRDNGGPLLPHKGHLTDILTDHTIARLKALNGSDEPWFLYHAFLAPHHPIQPADRYSKKFPDTPEGQYRALVTQMDDAIGRILKSVDKRNTLVVFVSDNGGTNKQRDNNFPFHGRKSEPYEGAYRTPLIISWPGALPRGSFIDDVVFNVDIYPTLLAATETALEERIDGKNLWPLMLNGISPGPRGRSWETYSANINAMNFSLLSADGRWRLAAPQAFDQELFDLTENPAGALDAAPAHPDRVSELLAQYWLSHWQNSLVPVSAEPSADGSATQYRGFDTLRTPYRNGFAVGLSLGPIDPAREALLAEQAGVWSRTYAPGAGLAWRIGDNTLYDSGFDATRCNPVILTGYLEERGHLSVRDPRSELKLYARGELRSQQRDITPPAIDDSSLASPTTVHNGGHAVFSNMMLSDWSDDYSPRIVSQFAELYRGAFVEHKLTLSRTAQMSKMLCKHDT